MGRSPRRSTVQILLQPSIRVMDAVREDELPNTLLDHVERHLRQQRHGVPSEFTPADRIEVSKQAHAARIPAPPQIEGKRPETSLQRDHELITISDLLDDRPQLGRRRDERSNIVGRKGPLLDGLHNQHTVQQSTFDHWHPEKRMEGFLASLGEEFEARMLLDIGHRDRLHLLGHHAGQPFTQVHSDLPNAVLPQSHRRGQDQVSPVSLEKVDRADIDRQPRLQDSNAVGQHMGRLGVSSRHHRRLMGMACRHL